VEYGREVLCLGPRHAVEDKGAEVATPLPLLPLLFKDQHKQALFRATLVILVSSPISSLGCVGEPMGTGGSFSPTGEPTGTDLLSCITLLFPI
jgi:hypothetical protein